ncbi:MAG: hopanoid-associated sugar epimerase [Gammaproteobacteria bacterium]
MTVLVTGASGFLGSAVARLLLERGDAVRVLTRPSSDPTNIVGLDVEVVHGDLRDPQSLAGAVSGVDALFHVAADYRLWVRDTDELYASNVEGTRNLMRAALDAGVGRVVYTSSVATLGINRDGKPADEDTPVGLDDMIGHYKRSKFLAERVVDELVAGAGLPAVIVNPSTPIGPRDVKPTPTGRIVRDAALGRIPAYVDTGLNVAHVDDVARGHLLAFEHGAVGRRYILGGENLSLREILGIVAAWCDRPPPRIRLPRRAVYPVAWVSEWWAALSRGPEPQATVDGLRMAAKKMFFDSARAEAELGYSARPASRAIHDALAWFENAGAIPRRRERG